MIINVTIISQKLLRVKNNYFYSFFFIFLFDFFTYTMSRSTPLNRLSNKNSSGEKNQLVDEILKELENTQMLQTPQPPPQQAPQPLPQQAPQQPPQQAPQPPPQPPPQPRPQPLPQPRPLNIVPQHTEAEEEDIDLYSMLLSEIKQPIVVVLLYTLFQTKQVQKVMTDILPRVQNTMLGVVVKAIILGILYYVINKIL